jgi:FkbM family methyltransferase
LKVTFRSRAKAWIRKPWRHQARSIAFHAKVDKLLVPLFRLAALFNNPVFRAARFDSLRQSQDFTFSARDGEYFVVITRDQVISKLLYIDGIFDFQKLELARSLLGRAFELRTLIDIGANIGTVCIPAVKRGLVEKAIAIEPEPTNYRILVANIYLNDLADKIVTHNVALGPQDDQSLVLELSPDNSGDHRIQFGKESGSYSEALRKTITVKSERLDTLIPAIDRSSTLIWMDTQGFEGLILQGATEMLSSRVPLVTEFWPYGMARTNSFDAFKSALLRYETCFDLSSPNPTPIRLTTRFLDDLHSKLSAHSDFTDLLVT